MKADDAGRAKARVWEGSESAEVEYEGNMSTNEARMCCKLFHFANILAALESGRTHVGIATESRDSDRILPRQSLGLSRSERDLWFLDGEHGMNLLGIRSGFYPWGSVGFVKRSAQRVRNVRN
jgi:hypothetical protein